MLAGAGWAAATCLHLEQSVGIPQKALLVGGAELTISLLAGAAFLFRVPRKRASVYWFGVGFILALLAASPQIANGVSKITLLCAGAPFFGVPGWGTPWAALAAAAALFLGTGAAVCAFGRRIIRPVKPDVPSDDGPKRSARTRVYLGGTCNGSTWREALIALLNTKRVDFFNPVVLEWTKAAQQREIRERKKCDYCLYVLTPLMVGFYGAVEAALDSVAQPQKVLFCVLDEDGGQVWNEHNHKSLQSMKQMIRDRGCRIFDDLKQVADFLNAR